MTALRQAQRLAVPLVLLAAALGLPFLITSPYEMGVLLQALIFCILVLGFNFTLGFTRRISLGHIGFWAIGAYATGLLTTQTELSGVVAMLVGVGVAALLALFLALLTNGLHAHYLALATLGFGQIVQIVATNWVDFTQGSNGVSAIPPFSVAGYEFTGLRQQYFLAAGFVAFGLWFTHRFVTSKSGRDAFALRQSEIAAASLGIQTDRVKTVTLVISAVFAAVAGSLYAHTYGYISPDAFTFAAMLLVLAMIVVGGPGTLSGPIIGAVLLTYLPEWLRVGDEYRLLGYGVLLFVMVLWAPRGIAGLVSGATKAVLGGVGGGRRRTEAADASGDAEPAPAVPKEEAPLR